jgi:hypothetical protein
MDQILSFVNPGALSNDQLQVVWANLLQGCGVGGDGEVSASALTPAQAEAGDVAMGDSLPVLAAPSAPAVPAIHAVPTITVAETVSAPPTISTCPTSNVDMNTLPGLSAVSLALPPLPATPSLPADTADLHGVTPTLAATFAAFESAGVRFHPSPEN